MEEDKSKKYENLAKIIYKIIQMLFFILFGMMGFLSIGVILLYALLPKPIPEPVPAIYKNFIDFHESFRASWVLDETNTTIRFLLQAETRGWVGIGISPDGKMSNSDMIIVKL
jgi:hypothetical protein